MVWRTSSILTNLPAKFHCDARPLSATSVFLSLFLSVSSVLFRDLSCSSFRFPPKKTTISIRMAPYA